MRERIKGIIYKILFCRALLPAREIIWNLLKERLKTRQEGIVVIGDTLSLIEEVRKEVRTGLKDDEARNLYLAVLSTKKIQGDVAEAGVREGGSAKLICEAKGDKTLHLFDTFKGLPKGLTEGHPFYEYELPPIREAKRHLAKYKGVHFHKGLIPYTFDAVRHKSFSFVHLDVDLYKSTLDCLKFFYTRMSLGGVIISHDYPSEIGVKMAFDEFFEGKNETVFRISNNQCMIVKVEN